MIKYFEHKQIDKKKWDECIRHSSNGMVYACSWYLDIVSPGWNALIDGDYKTIFPLTWRKKYGIMYLHQPFFTQQLGIFSVENNISEKTVLEFLNSIPDEYRFIEIQLNSQNTCHQSDFKVSERLTHHLHMNKPYEELFKNYSENLKRNIKRAEKNQLKLIELSNAEDIIQLFRKNKGAEISNLKKKDYDILSQLIQSASQRNLIHIIGAVNRANDICAGAIFLQSNHKYIFLFSATDKLAKETGAMSRIIDSFIRDHAGEKINLDFEGSMDKNLARFYKSFGSKEVVYLQIKKNTLPAYVKWIKG